MHRTLAVTLLAASLVWTTISPTLRLPLNLISGQTHGTTSKDIPGKIVNGSVIANVQPVLDDCPGAAPPSRGKHDGW